MQKSHPIYKKTLVILMYIFLIIYVISFFGLNFRNDEGFTMSLVHHSFENLIRIDSYDVHPPLYYLILKLFLSITTFWTNSIFIKIIFARLFSFISFCLSFYLLTKIFNINQYKIKKQFLFVFILLFPSVLFFATQIRMYSFGAFLLILGIYIYQKLLKHYSFKFLALFFLCMLAASYVHYYYALFAGLFIILSCASYLLNKKYKKAFVFFSLDVFLCICYLPWGLYTINNVINGMKYSSNFSINKIFIQISKIILFPTGVLNSSLNGLNLISKVILIILIYILLLIGAYFVLFYFDKRFKVIFIINIIIVICLSLIGTISDLFGYEFSVRFLYPSFLILLFMIAISLMRFNKDITKAIFVIIVLFVSIMALICNIDNISTFRNNYCMNRYYQTRTKNVYININNKYSSNKFRMQLLRTHRAFRYTDKATMLMYLNKHMVINHKMSNNKVGKKLWTNIKYYKHIK